MSNDDLISRREATTIPILPIEHRKYQTMNLDDVYDLGWLDCQNCIEKLLPAQCMADNFPIRKAIPDGWFCAGAERRTDD